MSCLNIHPAQFCYLSDETFVLKIPELCIASPALVGIIGLNGSGKSTFLKLLARHLISRDFSFSLDEKELANLPLSHFARHVSYLPQHIAFFPPYSVEEVLFHSRYPYNTRLRYTSQEQKRIQNFINIFQLASLKEKVLSNLSGGQQKSVLIASTFAQETPIILFDEPFNSLDIPHQWQLGKILRSCLHDDQIVFLSSHNLELLLEYTDRILLFKEGDIDGIYLTEEIISQPILLENTLRCQVIIDEGKRTENTFITYKI